VRAPALGEHQLCHRIERGQAGNQVKALDVAHQVDLVDDDDVGTFDLLGQQRAQRAFIVLTGRRAALRQEIGAAIVIQEGMAVDHGHHGVNARHVVQRNTFFGAEVEGGRDRHRLDNPGRLDQQTVGKRERVADMDNATLLQ
jgi:hypothetical protein